LLAALGARRGFFAASAAVNEPSSWPGGGSGRSGAIVRAAGKPPRVRSAETARQSSPRNSARSARRRRVSPGSSTSTPFLRALFQARNWSAAPA